MDRSLVAYLNVDPNQVLTEYTSGYTPVHYNYSYIMSRARPVFNFHVIEEMIMDPRVLFGLLLIKGPIESNARFVVKAEDEEIENYIIDELNRFWVRGVGKVLEGIEWGFSSNEVIYSKDDDGLHFEDLEHFLSRDVQVVSHRGRRSGILVNNVEDYYYNAKSVYLGGPKHFHYVHWRKMDKHYGRSRLWSTVVPWWEVWAKGGYRDIRRLWFGKNSFNGGLLRYPKGRTNVPNRGAIDNHDLAMEMAVKMATGGVTVAPSTKNAGGKADDYEWTFEGTKGNNVPTGLFEYGGTLRIEILESMGIPYEVIEASGNEGFGSSSGREIPLLAYNAILQEISKDIITDFRQQILDFLLMVRYRRKVKYEINPLPLQTPSQEAENPVTTPQDDEDQSRSQESSNGTTSGTATEGSREDQGNTPQAARGVAFSMRKQTTE